MVVVVAAVVVVCVIIYYPAAEATAVAVSIYLFPWPRTGLVGHGGTPNRHNKRTKENRTQKGCAPRKERKRRKDEGNRHIQRGARHSLLSLSPLPLLLHILLACGAHARHLMKRWFLD